MPCLSVAKLKLSTFIAGFPLIENMLLPSVLVVVILLAKGRKEANEAYWFC